MICTAKQITQEIKNAFYRVTIQFHQRTYMRIHVPQYIVHDKTFSFSESADDREDDGFAICKFWIQKQATYDCFVVLDLRVIPFTTQIE